MKTMLKLIIAAVILVGGLLIARYYIDTKPEPQAKKRGKDATMVEVKELTKQNLPARVQANGTVKPARQITVSPEVTGRITFISPEIIPGGLVKKGQTLFTIDPRDYQSILEQRKSTLATAQKNLKVELGNQEVARREYELLGSSVTDSQKALLLRVPHLESIRAELASAQAALDKALLDLERCTVTAPFNGIIGEKFVDEGARVAPGSSLITLVGTDQYWIEALVFVDQLKWLEIPENQQQKGSSAQVFFSAGWGEDKSLPGYVLRVIPELEQSGRLARILVAVDDPLALSEQSPAGQPKLLIDAYVRLEIQGRIVEDIYPIQREYIHDGDKLWLMGSDKTLQFHKISPLFKDREVVYVKNGLSPDQKLITTNLAGPVEGMSLRLENDNPETATDNSSRTQP